EYGLPITLLLKESESDKTSGGNPLSIQINRKAL
ncbi:hypothetical protein GGD81_002400, partial [Rhodobium orientis]|nr:hypothetical protein [Rhodobium orientis]